MSDSPENVVHLHAKADRKRPPLDLPARITAALERHKARLAEARAVAELLGGKLLDSSPESTTTRDIDLAVMSCDAIVRLLSEAAKELTVASIICTPPGE